MIVMLAMLSLLLGTQVQAMSQIRSQPASVSGAAKASSQSFEEIAARAMQAWKEGNDAEALQLFREGLKLRAGWKEGLWYSGAISYQQQHYRGAREQLLHYLARYPREGAGWALVGLCDYKLHEYAHAGDDLQHALSLGLQGNKELLGSVYYYSALLLTRDERFHESAAMLYLLQKHQDGIDVNAPLELSLGLNALGYALLPEEIPPDRLDLVRQSGAAVLARFEQQRDQAKSLLLPLLRQYPGEQGLHFQYGLMLLEDHSPEGVAEMQKAIELALSNPEPYLSLAEYYLELEQNSEALKQIDKALALDPESASAHLTKGRILRASGDLSAAIVQFEVVRKIAPVDTRVLSDLLYAYQKTGRQEEAAKLKKELEKLNPEREAEK